MPEVVSAFLTITAVIAWLNARFLKLPSTIGVMVAALILSAATILLDLAGVGPHVITRPNCSARSIFPTS